MTQRVLDPGLPGQITTSYTWNDFDRLVRWEKQPAGTSETHGYDAGGIRKSKIGTDGVKVEFKYSGLPVLSEKRDPSGTPTEWAFIRAPVFSQHHRSDPEDRPGLPALGPPARRSQGRSHREHQASPAHGGRAVGDDPGRSDRTPGDTRPGHFHGPSGPGHHGHAYFTGIGTPACQRLELRQLDLRSRLLHLPERAFALETELAEPLARYLWDARPRLEPASGELALFLGKDGQRLLNGRMNQLLAAYGRQAGIQQPVNVLALRRARKVRASSD
ncbi:MAG: hypothetical protein HY319_10400 [Armatimonadetes bacterium]|nr:hypothetical protein [Armatimonadota bacterium]